MTELGPLTQKAKLVYADPNWLYNQFGAKKHGAARGHYSTSPVDDICKIPVSDFTEKDAYLVLCATLPKLPEAFKVAKAWGFDEYVTACPWIKVSPNSKQETPEGFWGPFIRLVRTGIGFWFQATCELVLIFRKGKPKKRSKTLVKGLLCGSEGILFCPVKGHSAKPMALYDWLMSTFQGPYLELYARSQVFGWTSVGSELGWWMDERGIIPLDKQANSDTLQLPEEGLENVEGQSAS